MKALIISGKLGPVAVITHDWATGRTAYRGPKESELSMAIHTMLGKSIVQIGSNKDSGYYGLRRIVGTGDPAYLSAFRARFLSTTWTLTDPFMVTGTDIDQVSDTLAERYLRSNHGVQENGEKQPDRTGIHSGTTGTPTPTQAAAEPSTQGR